MKRRLGRQRRSFKLRRFRSWGIHRRLLSICRCWGARSRKKLPVSESASEFNTRARRRLIAEAAKGRGPDRGKGLVARVGRSAGEGGRGLWEPPGTPRDIPRRFISNDDANPGSFALRGTAPLLWNARRSTLPGRALSSFHHPRERRKRGEKEALTEREKTREQAPSRWWSAARLRGAPSRGTCGLAYREGRRMGTRAARSWSGGVQVTAARDDGDWQTGRGGGR